MNGFVDFITGLADHRIIRLIAIVMSVIVVVILAVALVVAGIGLASVLLLIFLVALSIYFGSIKVLSGSALLAILLQVVGGTIQEFVNVWFASPETSQFFAIVDKHGFVNLTLAFFFFFHLLSFGTRNINLFRFDNKVNVENKMESRETGGRDDAEEEAPGRVVEGKVSSRRRRGS